MGEWLSGDNLKEKSQLYAFHKHLSSLLSNFASKATGYIDGTEGGESKKGRTVYAGGDDYLGFVNLHYLFDALKGLREMFKIEVNDNLKNGKIDGNRIEFDLKEKEMSFSAGIAIAHYKTPLSEVLKWARNMEKEAKGIDNEKDKFGIAVLKHSGETNKMVLPFNDDYTTKLNDIISALKDDFSSTFINSLGREMMYVVDNAQEDIDYTLRLALQAESKRLIKRASKKENNNTGIESLSSNVNALMAVSIRNNTDEPLINFRSALDICDFVNRKMNSNE
jgi:CRISPR-associated protein Cmr2